MARGARGKTVLSAVAGTSLVVVLGGAAVVGGGYAAWGDDDGARNAGPAVSGMSAPRTTGPLIPLPPNPIVGGGSTDTDDPTVTRPPTETETPDSTETRTETRTETEAADPPYRGSGADLRTCDGLTQELSSLLERFSSQSNELDGQPSGSARAQRLRQQLVDLQGRINLLDGQLNRQCPSTGVAEAAPPPLPAPVQQVPAQSAPRGIATGDGSFPD